MKHWQKKALWATLIIVLALVVTPWLTRNQTTTSAAALDYLNPLVREETVYVSPATNSVQWHANNHGGIDYRYEVTSYDASGCPRALQLTVSDQPLARNAYLAVKTKGQTVLGWHRVPASQVPPSALHHLQE
ncbi:YxeA family protein [Lacticaseibacillus sp. GG6-2]